MPKSPAASKREVVSAFKAAQLQARTLDSLLPILEQVAKDSEVSKAILSRPTVWGRLRWLVLGR